jgi:hypothetical protein
VQEVEARQQLETLRRDEKTQGRTLFGLNAKVAHFEERKTTLDEEKVTQRTKKAEVYFFRFYR